MFASSVSRELLVDSITLRETNEISSIASALSFWGQKERVIPTDIASIKYMKDVLNLPLREFLLFILNTHKVSGSCEHKTQIWWRRVFSVISTLKIQDKAGSNGGDVDLTLTSSLFHILASRVMAVKNDPNLYVPGLPDCESTQKLIQLNRLEQCCLATKLAMDQGYIPPQRSADWWEKEIRSARALASGGECFQSTAATSLMIICS